MASAPELLAFDGPPPPQGDANKAPAKGPDGKGEAPKEDKGAAVQKMLDTGIAAYEADKMRQAIRAFDTAIRNGGLSSQQMAKALYYRGLAYRKGGNLSLAIADLTSAAWLNGGLSPAEKQEALAARDAAYREAGVSDVPQASQSTAVAGGDVGSSQWQTAPPSASAPPAAPVASAPPPAAQQTATYAPARPPPPPAPTSSSSSSSGGVGGFFNSITNMFGGGSSEPSPAVTTTAAIAEPPAAAPAPAPAASAWSQTTEVAPTPPPAPPPAQVPQPAPPPVTEAAPPPPAQAAPPPAAPFSTQTQVSAVAPPIAAPPQAAEAPSGKFHVQVAAVRSRSEAYALSVRLVSQLGAEFGSRRPAVEETVIGSMGTFYRVSVGPYASEQEPKQLCGSLRASGFDCLVITQ